MPALRTILLPTAGTWQLALAAVLAATPSMAKQKASLDLSDLSVARRFASRIEEAFLQQDVDAINAAIDWRTIFERSTAGLTMPNAEFERGLWVGFEQALAKPTAMASLIAGASDYSLVKVHGTEREPRALFRIITEGGVNYHDYTCDERDGQAVATSCYVYAAGETMSDTLGRMFVIGLGDMNSTWIQQIFGGRAPGETMNLLFAFIEASRGADYTAVTDAYEALPKPLQSEKSMLLVHTLAAQRLAPTEEYLRLLDLMAEEFAGDPMLDLMLIDAMILREDHEACLASLHRLQDRVGADPWLDLIEAGVLANAGKHEAAAEKARAAVVRLPDIVDVGFVMIDLLISVEDWPEVARTLDRLEVEFGVEWQDLRDVEDYDAFVESHAGQMWLADHGFID